METIMNIWEIWAIRIIREIWIIRNTTKSKVPGRCSARAIGAFTCETKGRVTMKVIIPFRVDL